jgi:hypothetical protein
MQLGIDRLCDLGLMEHPLKGGISPGTPLKAAAEIAELHQLPR